MLSRDEILELEAGRGFDALIAEELGWQWWHRVDADGEGRNALWPFDLDYAGWERGKQEGMKAIHAMPHYSAKEADALPLLWHLQTRYGAVCILTNAEWGEKMVVVACRGLDSSPPSSLPIALCRLLLLLAERDKQEATSPKVEEMTNG